MSKFKVGDIVKNNGSGVACSSVLPDDGTVLTVVNDGGTLQVKRNGSNCSCQSGWELVSSNNNFMVEGLIAAFKGLTVGEPQKSFRKLGITDEQDLMTTDGSRIFLSWLLTRYADDFSKEVVDGLKKQDEEEKKK
jgi:hypothetical protein